MLTPTEQRVLLWCLETQQHIQRILEDHRPQEEIKNRLMIFWHMLESDKQRLMRKQTEL